MSGQDKKTRKRTYARNRTSLSRRGYEKNPEPDSIFILKLIIVIIAGSFWIKFAGPTTIFGIYIAGLPIGLLVGLVFIHLLEKRPNNRKIWFSVIIMVTIISYFLPSGIVL